MRWHRRGPLVVMGVAGTRRHGTESCYGGGCRQPECREAHRCYAASNRQRKGKSETGLRREANQQARGGKSQREILNELKSGPCMDCGASYPPIVMEFDHRPGEQKKCDVARLAQPGTGLDTLLAEVAKCDLVCANCHRLRTLARKAA